VYRKISRSRKAEYGRGDPSPRPRGTLYPQKLTLTLPTRGGRLVGIVRSRTKATELLLLLLLSLLLLQDNFYYNAVVSYFIRVYIHVKRRVLLCYRSKGQHVSNEAYDLRIHAVIIRSHMFNVNTQISTILCDCEVVSNIREKYPVRIITRITILVCTNCN
jgi:hypothetical protein